MIPIQPVCGEFNWRQLPRNRGYELTLNGEFAGSLRHPTISSTACEASTPSCNWTFLRTGFWGTGTEIVDSASRQHVATFQPAWNNRGTLIFADGQSFSLECKGIWHPTWTIKSSAGESVGWLHMREKTAEIAPGAVLDAERQMLLVMFLLYRVLQAEEDAAIVAVAAAS